METRKQRNFITPILVLLVSTLFLLSGCGDRVENADEVQDNTSSSETIHDVYQKEALSEENIRDNEFLYTQDDTSVITMYLTVSRGSESENTQYTWKEVNSHSTAWYKENDLKRFNVDGILQIDETGEGVTEDSFGYGEIVPNVSVQIRGQTSSVGDQKSYKIRIKEGKGEYAGQRTLCLNKHIFDPYRFTNKLMYDLLETIPQLVSNRSQFVHLYVKDCTENADGDFQDYGLFTMIEQVNKTYLKNHGLDDRGELYKIQHFEWLSYPDVMIPIDDEEYDKKAFERYLEIKGREDHDNLQKVLEKLDNSRIPINEIIEEHFNVENITYWMAFQILCGNYDSGANNLYIYSPQNSEKIYFISWDMDDAFSHYYREEVGIVETGSWEQGIGYHIGLKLINRMLKEEIYREALDSAIEDLKNNYLTPNKIKKMVNGYFNVVEPYITSEPDNENLVIPVETIRRLINKLPDEVNIQYEKYQESMKKPWPFFVYPPEPTNGKFLICWEIAYDIGHEMVTYDYYIARDEMFNDIVLSAKGLPVTADYIDPLPPGQYYLKVQARNDSGYINDCYDYIVVDGGKIYGCFAFVVNEDGTVS